MTNAETLARAIEEGRSDPIAVTELATILAKDWCAQWGGWPDESNERVLQIWAHRPAARNLFAAIKRGAKTDRQSLARAVAN